MCVSAASPWYVSTHRNCMYVSYCKCLYLFGYVRTSIYCICLLMLKDHEQNHSDCQIEDTVWDVTVHEPL